MRAGGFASLLQLRVTESPSTVSPEETITALVFLGESDQKEYKYSHVYTNTGILYKDPTMLNENLMSPRWYSTGISQPCIIES